MYQAFGLEGGGARRQASFWGVGVSHLPPGRLCPSVPLLVGADGVTRFQQLLSGPGDVIWATRLGGSVPERGGAALPSRRDTPPLSPRPWDLEVTEKCYLMGVPLTHTAGEPLGGGLPSFAHNLPVSTTGRVQSIQAVPGVSSHPSELLVWSCYRLTSVVFLSVESKH